jgi:hypothetical protein
VFTDFRWVVFHLGGFPLDFITVSALSRRD